MNLKMAAKVRFYLRVCLVDIDMNDVIFFSLCEFALFFGRKVLAWRRNAFLSRSLSCSRAR
jgi:hypothetical protein